MPFPPPLITTQADLERFLDDIADHERLAVDTEANSMHAYRERLCLVQVSSPDGEYLLDPLAGLDLRPFFDVLEEPEVVKVFHDAEFDVLQLRRAFGIRLRGLCDTKVAAMAAGEISVGLAALVERHFGVELDKSHQRSDWGRRPLDAEQMEYARLDVRYLLPLAELLEERIAAMDPIVRLEVEGECRRLESLVPPEPKSDADAWARLKGTGDLTPRERRRAHDLFLWREAEAERRDRPPFKIIGNAAILAIARSKATSPQELESVSGIPRSIGRRWGKGIARVLRASDDKPGLAAPAPPRASREERVLADEDRLVLDRLKWRKDAAADRPTDPSLVLNREVLETLAACRPRPRSHEDLEATGLLEGWRIDVYGEGILDAIEG